MPAGNNFLILDDVSASLELASTVGRSILTEPARAVQAAVSSLAHRRGWVVVDYMCFRTWAQSTLERSQDPWLVLDPLFSADQHDDRVIRLRLSRVFGHIGAGLEGAPWAPGFASASGRVAVLDDVIASGRTMRLVAGLACQRRLEISQIATCAAHSEGVRSLRHEGLTAPVTPYLSGEWRTLHLRDGCAHLPFSGRHSGLNLASESRVEAVELRILAHHAVGSPWQGLMIDTEVREAVLGGQATIVSSLTAHLGRIPRVSDLELLGSSIPATVTPGVRADLQTALADLLPSS